MKTQIEGIGLKEIFRMTSAPGWLLMLQPVLFIVLSRRRSFNDYASVDATAIAFVLYAIICFIVAYKTIFKSQEYTLGKDVLTHSPIIWFIIYTVLGAISALWSVVPSLSGYRAFECFATILLICACIQELFETGNRRFIILWTLFYASWECLWAIVNTMRWSLNISTILQSSQFSATIFFFIALYFTPRKWYNYVVIVMSIFSMSTVAYMGMALGLISAFWMNTKVKALAIACACVMILGTIAIGPYNLLKQTIFFDKEDISIEDTTGRNHIMDAALESIDSHPAGMGFFAAEPYVLTQKHLGAINAHNSLFSAGMGLGYPGVILMVIFFITMGFTVFSKYIDRDVKPMLIGCCCVAFMHCMGNPSLGSRVYAAWIPSAYIFILTCFYYVDGKYYEEIEDNDTEEELIESE